ncbi:NAD(P)/FAD-dependent oxidoreductase [Fluviicola chungangensis]|uniref:FAD-binding protein n=1 Tax=Fluviicola chungangensis TaxID=2597671 RepID=A0A556MR79_9FLAO|nr:FAD-binding protein [Fluviicola chungangensis]TSJ42417.1 FAD-binding protein [Fluviicola chungangensis]
MQVQFQFSPEEAKDELFIRSAISRELNIPAGSFAYKWHKRSIDARKRDIKINASFEVFPDGIIPAFDAEFNPQKVTENSKTVHIIGAGPAGLYAGLRALELGLKPIVFERGKDVRARRRDLAKLNKEHQVNPESNYCFGEGGAGTYSDGKLYTRSKKRGDVMRALKWFVHFDAHEDIIVDAHPHIGTNKLPQIIVAMRNCIREFGGEVHFESKLTDIEMTDGAVRAIEINEQTKIPCNALILATGHSARDIFYLLKEKQVAIQAKAFALGVRVEHTQELIDEIQYHGRHNDWFLPPASYSLVTQVQDKGVYSFCMCPGGIIAPCATADGEVVTNGWSPSKRNNPTSNSGIVVSVEPGELPGYSPDNPLVGLEFQQKVERDCWKAAGSTQAVPAQRLKDFVEGRKSIDFPRTSYQPGIVSVDLNTVLPDFIAKRLRQAFIDFDRKMRGFLTNDAVLHAPESRTSSPVSVPRDNETCMSINTKGLFPCGEGAGYAGGIISAAIDGMKCADAVKTYLEQN